MISEEYLSAVDLANDIKVKKVSPVEVLEETIDMIEKRNASLNAFTYTDYEGAREAAKAAEKKLMDGEAEGDFFGVPSAVKDFQQSIPGYPWTMGGVKAVSHLKDERWGLYAKSLRDEGALFVGKTNSPSFAFSGTCDNKMFGPTSTPFKIGHNSGGSSGGSAAAVGDGILQIAHATDGGGSIRIPAAWCGVYGFKASIGTISTAPRPNAWALTPCHAWEGTVSRTVKDAAYALQAMSGYDPFDPNSHEMTEKNYRAAIEGSMKGWKIAYTPDWGIFPVEKEVQEIVDDAVRVFEQAGATVEMFDPGIGRSAFDLAETWCRIVSVEALQSIEGFKERGIDLLKDFPEDLPRWLVYWQSIVGAQTVREFCHDQSIRTEIFDMMQGAFQKYDLIISPTTTCTPVKNDHANLTPGPAEVNGIKVEPLIGFCETFFCNFSGNPAASIPAGLTSESLPVGMQIIGKRFHDEDVLTASAAFEKHQPWADTYKITAARPL